MTNNTLPFQGSMVAIVTPMQADGSLDWDALDNLVEFHITEGTDAIIAVGTSGESATLNVDEHLRVVKRVLEKTNKRIPIIAGTGANSTNEAIELTKEAKAIGVDGCLLVVPYYNKPTQEGLYRHFSAVADAVDVPQVLYNVPGRTITDMSHETTLRLASHPNIVGIKDATGDMARGKALIEAAPEGFSIFSGDDFTAFELMLMGGKGNISVTANIAPKLMSELCRLAMSGDEAATRALQEKLMPLHEALFTESNPIPVKWAAYEMGLIPEGIRLPLTPLSEEFRAALVGHMRTVGLLD